MNTIEQSRREIASLPIAEKLSIWRDLGQDLDGLTEEEQATVAAEWNTEIAARADDIKSDNVTLLSGEEFEQLTRTLFADLGIKRDPRVVQVSSTEPEESQSKAIAAWNVELLRRKDEIVSGKATSVPWKDVESLVAKEFGSAK